MSANKAVHLRSNIDYYCNFYLLIVNLFGQSHLLTQPVVKCEWR